LDINVDGDGDGDVDINVDKRSARLLRPIVCSSAPSYRLLVCSSARLLVCSSARLLVFVCSSGPVVFGRPVRLVVSASDRFHF
jgi:hypothetical protein